MPVKTSQAAARVLAVLDLIAKHQPVRISGLAKLLGDDRSAIQRAVATLAEAGWIRPAAGTPALWELSAHIFAIAALPQSINMLRQRSRQVLEELRSQTGETAFVAIPDGMRFVVIESAESSHSLRSALRVGQFIEPQRTATGRAFLPYLREEQQAAMLGRRPSKAELAQFEESVRRGFGLSVGDISPGATNLAATLFGAQGEPIGVLVVSGPSERLNEERHEQVGSLLAKHAATLSRGRPAIPSPEMALSS